MSFAVEQSDGLELANLEHITHTLPSHELYSSSNNPLFASRLARHCCSDGQARTADLGGNRCLQSNTSFDTPFSRDHCDPVSQSDSNDHRYEADSHVPLHFQQHVSDNSNSFHAFEDPRDPLDSVKGRPGELWSTVLPTPNRNQRNPVFDLPRSQIDETPSYTGKGQGRMLDIDREPAQNGSEQYHNSVPLQTDQAHGVILHHNQRLPLDDRAFPSLPSSHTAAASHLNDMQFERRQYFRKKLHSLPMKARYLCRAVRCENCRVHGRLFQEPHANRQCHRGPYVKMVNVADESSVEPSDELFRLDEAAGPCGTTFDLADLAEEAGLAAEIRKRDVNALICVEWGMGMVIFLLGLAAVVAFLVEDT